MRLLITTPTAIVVDRYNVTSLRAEDASGSFGILDGHADFLTALSVCVLVWHEDDGPARFCAVRNGVLAMRDGKNLAVATREAVVGDDLDHLESQTIAHFHHVAEADATSRTASMEMQMKAIRQIIRYLRPRSSTVSGTVHD